MSEGGWDLDKVLVFREQFLSFLNHVTVNSKEQGPIVLGEHVYRAQHRFLDTLFRGLADDKHDFKVLKSRQLGLSTISRALTLFWTGVHSGLRGYMVYDTDAHKEEARLEILSMIQSLPPELEFPKIERQNRYLMELSNNSLINFAAAGVRSGKGSGTLGRSSGINYVHACLHPDTPVIVDHGRVKRIRDVKPGDMVVTHTGAQAKVVANVGRENDRGPMRRITPWLGEPVLCTGDHKIATERGLVFSRELKSDDWLVMPIRKITAQHAAAQLTSPLRAARKRGGTVAAAEGAIVPLDEEFGYAMGYYLAEGSMTYQRRGAEYRDAPSGLVFSRHRNEVAYADRAVKVLSPFTTGLRTTKDNPKCLTTTEHVYGSALARWVDDVFGAQDNKHIPDGVFTWGEDFCKGLLIGLLCGDGSKTASKVTTPKNRTYKFRRSDLRNDEYTLNHVSLSTTRASIAMQARDIAASLGIGWASVRYRGAGVFYGRNCKELYTVSWNGSAARKLRELMGLPTFPSKREYAQKYRVEGDSVLIRIRKLEDGVEQPFMFDLSVDHPDHTFRTPSMSVSNSELCSWENVEGLESFKNALAEDFPNRLYIWESTARGFNLWNEMWNEAKADSAHQVTTFLGWWAKDSQMIPREHPDFMRYGEEPPSEKELKKIKAVKVQYGWDITPEQLAWIRRKMDPTAEAEGDAPVEYEGDALRIQENPWTEEEAFQMTGATFFQPDDLTEIANKTASKKYSAYSYVCGMDFRDSRIVKAYNTRSIELKVWEDPVPEGVYIVAADVAFGSDEKNDRSACQVLRCYADEVEQVAEYAWPLVTSRQYAWVLLSLLGFYGKQPGAQVHFILEINGPGEATWNEIQNVKQIVQSGMYKVDLEDRGLLDMFKNVRNYFYTRSDSMSPGQSWQFKTSSQLKVAIMERLRDFVTNKRLTIRSLETLEEMKAITRDGDSIRAQGTKKDDRAIALALGVRCWEERVRRGMMAGKRTRANEEAKKRLTLKDQISIFNENQLSSFFAVKAGQRRRAAQAAAQAKWKSRR